MNTYFLGLLKVDQERRKYNILRNTSSSTWTKRKGWSIFSSKNSYLVSFSVFIAKDEEVGIEKEGQKWNLIHFYDFPDNEPHTEEPDIESEIYITKRELNMYLQLEKGFRGKNFLLRVDDSWLPGVVALLS